MMQNKNNISYEEYLELMQQEVAVRTGKRVQLKTVRKNNGLLLDGLIILAEDTNVFPSIYLNGYYKEFLTDGLEAVAEKLIALYEENKPEISFDLSSIMDISRVKPFIKMKLINYEKNQQLLETVPHIQILDLAVVFMVVVKTEDACQLETILVNNSFLEYWNVNVDSLYQIAQKNMVNGFETTALENIIVSAMGCNLEEECLQESKFNLYVLTTHHRLHGAIGMLNKELLNAFMKKYQTEKLIILPSSIHEVLLVPYNKEDMEETDFKAMVREINETELAPEEILSNNVYLYDGKELKIFE